MLGFWHKGGNWPFSSQEQALTSTISWNSFADSSLKLNEVNPDEILANYYNDLML